MESVSVDFELDQPRSAECRSEITTLVNAADMERCRYCDEIIAYWHAFCFSCGRSNSEAAADQSEQISDCEASFHESLGEEMVFCPECGLCLHPAAWRRTICDESSCITYDLFRLTQLVAKVIINPLRMEIIIIAPFNIKKFWRDVRDVPNICKVTRRLLLSSKDSSSNWLNNPNHYQFVYPPKFSPEGDLFADVDSDEMIAYDNV